MTTTPSAPGDPTGMVTALAMVTADADPDPNLNAGTVIGMIGADLSVDRLTTIIRGLILLNRVQAQLWAQALTERNQLASPPEQAFAVEDVFEVLGKTAAQFNQRLEGGG
jgi:ubiquinone biosynthesis protein UbiJ